MASNTATALGQSRSHVTSRALAAAAWGAVEGLTSPMPGVRGFKCGHVAGVLPAPYRPRSPLNSCAARTQALKMGQHAGDQSWQDEALGAARCWWALHELVQQPVLHGRGAP